MKSRVIIATIFCAISVSAFAVDCGGLDAKARHRIGCNKFFEMASISDGPLTTDNGQLTILLREVILCQAGNAQIVGTPLKR